MTIDERRALRGVVIHVLRKPPRGYGRDWVGSLSAPFGSRRDGLCAWCRQPVPNNRRRWHPICAAFYSAARGLVRHTNTDWPLLPHFHHADGSYRHPPGKGPIPCAECGKGYSEIDHELPLAVADEMGLRWSARARLPSNLRPLCRVCHRQKTKRDRALLAALRKPREAPPMLRLVG